jgi:alkanesulfonate monooxygenase SsuD/methylene tetrahydromethanopterin reductase-like flavin-dependent oxidoreductase (luciferase family)
VRDGSFFPSLLEPRRRAEKALVAVVQEAYVQSVSKGRLMLGVAAGWAEAEFEAVGAGDRFPVRGQVLDESIEAMRVLWTDSPAEFHGRRVSFPAVDIGPRPARGIPIIVCGNSAAARRRAARLGDGWNPTALGAAETAAGMAELSRMRQEYARDGPFVSVGSLRFDDDMQAARDVLGPYAENGLDVMICRLTDPDPAGVLDRLRRFGREVLPAFDAA